MQVKTTMALACLPISHAVGVQVNLPQCSVHGFFKVCTLHGTAGESSRHARNPNTTLLDQPPARNMLLHDARALRLFNRPKNMRCSRAVSLSHSRLSCSQQWHIIWA
jgi:hypothetical protein